MRVVVVDDHDLFRTGLASLLGATEGIEVVGQASGGRMGARLATELHPDVVLMDIRMPDLSGPEATRRILEHDPAIRVLALTVTSERSEVAAMLQAGACGFLGKDTPIDSLVVAIRAAASGSAWLSPAAAELVLGQIRSVPPPHTVGTRALDQLTAREIDVLRLLAEGKENAEIAAALSISPRTAKNHVSSLLAKLGLPSRVQAAVFAVRQGIG